MNSFEIPAELRQFVESAVASGSFQSEGAVIVEGLRLLERREGLRQKVEAGIAQLQRGEFVEYDAQGLAERCEQIKAEGRRRLHGEGDAE